MTVVTETRPTQTRVTETMRATVFHGPGDIRVESVPRPRAGVGEAVVRVTTTTICGTDIHILKGEYPVRPGLIIGHEPVGVIDELGPGVTGYRSRSARPRPGASPRAASAAPACPATSASAATATATRPWAAGASATPSTARRPSTSSFPSAQANLTPDPRRRHRRAGRAAVRHRLDRLQRPGIGRRQDRRRGRRVRAGSDRPVRRRRREADGRLAHHRRRQRPGPARDGHGRWAPTSSLDFTQVDVVAEVKRSDRRRRRRDRRGARHAGHVRERAALPAAGRHPVEPRCLLGQARDAVRRVRGGTRRSPDRHDALPGRQGADAAAHRHRANRVASTRSR